MTYTRSARFAADPSSITFFTLSALTAATGVTQHLVTHAPLAASLLHDALLLNVGLGGLFFASGHLLHPDCVARHIGWATGNPFQIELGFANLAFGLLGLTAAFVPPAFTLPVVLAVLTFYWGAASLHLRELRTLGNTSAGNAGFVLYYDLLLPSVMLLLWLLAR